MMHLLKEGFVKCRPQRTRCGLTMRLSEQSRICHKIAKGNVLPSKSLPTSSVHTIQHQNLTTVSRIKFLKVFQYNTVATINHSLSSTHITANTINSTALTLRPFTTHTSTLSASESNVPSKEPDSEQSKKHQQQQQPESKLKHHFSYDELCERTSYLISVINKGRSSSNVGVNNDENSTGGTINDQKLPEKLVDKDSLTDINDSAATMHDDPYYTTKKHVFMDDCYDVMEAWMELAKQNFINNRHLEEERNPLKISKHLVDRRLEYPRRALSLLRALQSDYSIEGNFNHSQQWIPTVSYYEVVLRAYVECRGGEYSAKEATELLQSMQVACRKYVQDHKSRGRLNDIHAKVLVPEPSTKAFNIVIDCWAKSNSNFSGYKAEDILLMMQAWRKECEEQKGDTCYTGCLPNSATYSSIVNAWTKSGHTAVPTNTLRVLHQALHERERHVLAGTDDESNEVNVQTFNSTMYAWARSIKYQTPETILSTMEKLLLLMLNLDESNKLKQRLTPTVQTYANFIYFWQRIEKVRNDGEAAKRAEDVLQKITDFYNNGGNIGLPTIECFTMCISAWSHCAATVNHATSRAEMLFAQALSWYETGMDNELRVDSSFGNALLQTWANATAVPNDVFLKKSWQVLERLGEYGVKPHAKLYVSILGGMANRFMANEAIELLEQLERDYKLDQSNQRPNLILYSGTLNTIKNYVKHTGTMYTEAERLLEKMIALSSSERPDLLPDPRVYLLVLQALSHSKEILPVAKITKAQSLMQKMREHIAKTKIYSKSELAYEAFLKVCLECRDTPAYHHLALSAAIGEIDVFEAASYEGKENDKVYMAGFNVIVKMCADNAERKRLMDRLLVQCANAGYITKPMLSYCARYTTIKPFHEQHQSCRNVHGYLKPTRQ